MIKKRNKFILRTIFFALTLSQVFYPMHQEGVVDQEVTGLTVGMESTFRVVPPPRPGSVCVPCEVPSSIAIPVYWDLRAQSESQSYGLSGSESRASSTREPDKVDQLDLMLSHDRGIQFIRKTIGHSYYKELKRAMEILRGLKNQERELVADRTNAILPEINIRYPSVSKSYWLFMAFRDACYEAQLARPALDNPIFAFPEQGYSKGSVVELPSSEPSPGYVEYLNQGLVELEALRKKLVELRAAKSRIITSGLCLQLDLVQKANELIEKIDQLVNKDTGQFRKQLFLLNPLIEKLKERNADWINVNVSVFGRIFNSAYDFVYEEETVSRMDVYRTLVHEFLKDLQASFKERSQEALQEHIQAYNYGIEDLEILLANDSSVSFAYYIAMETLRVYESQKKTDLPEPLWLIFLNVCSDDDSLTEFNLLSQDPRDARVAALQAYEKKACEDAARLAASASSVADSVSPDIRVVRHNSKWANFLEDVKISFSATHLNGFRVKLHEKFHRTFELAKDGNGLSSDELALLAEQMRKEFCESSPEMKVLKPLWLVFFELWGLQEIILKPYRDEVAIQAARVATSSPEQLEQASPSLRRKRVSFLGDVPDKNSSGLPISGGQTLLSITPTFVYDLDLPRRPGLVPVRALSETGEHDQAKPDSENPSQEGLDVSLTPEESKAVRDALLAVD